jgi:glycosyltransferase involved in cell wall biosynthesis
MGAQANRSFAVISTASRSAPYLPPASVSAESAIICTFSMERWELLQAAIKTACRQTVAFKEVIVVVDHNEELFAWVSATYPGVRVVKNTFPRGLSGARNSGVLAATGEIIAFLDDDATIIPKWVERAVEAFACPDIVGVGGLVLPRWETDQPSWFPPEFLWVLGCTYRGAPSEPSVVRNTFGGNSAFRSEVFRRVGLFRVGIGRVGSIPLGGEETEFCIRVHRAIPDGKLLYDPSLLMHHTVSARRATWTYFLSRCWYEGQSKAHITRLVGGKESLSSERRHMLKVLPVAVLRECSSGVTCRTGGLGRAAAMVAGLAATASGFVHGICSGSRWPRKARPVPTETGAAAIPQLAPAGTLSAIICAYTEERWDCLTAAVASLDSQTVQASQVVVVIDHNPALFARARAAFPRALVIENEGKRGPSSSRNSGVIRTDSDIVAFLDDDAVAETHWVEKTLELYADPMIIASGGSAIPSWEVPAPAWFPPEFNWIVGCTFAGQPDRRAPIRNLFSVNMAVRREAFDAVGGFRDGIGRLGTIPIGCEETELCIRIGQHFPERIILYDPEIRVFHTVHAWRGTWRYFRRRCWGEGLSKAAISHFVGQSAALASEISYVKYVLPMAVLRQMIGAGRHRDGMYLRRALAIIAGLAITTGGYLTGVAMLALKQGSPQNQPPPALPRRIHSLPAVGCSPIGNEHLDKRIVTGA